MATSAAFQNQAPLGQIQVLDRAVRLLRILGEAGAPLRPSRLAELADLTPSTTRRIMSSLCANSLCAQGPDGSYRLGLLLFELGTRVESAFDLRERSRPALVRLSELTHLTAFLCVRNGRQATAIDRVDGRYAFSLALTVGGSLPLHAGAAPRVFLAHEPESEVRRYVREGNPLERFTDRTLVDVGELLADLRAGRERGYIVSDEDVTPGVAAVGAPVFDYSDDGRPIGAVSVAGLVPHILGEQREMIAQLLVETAQLVSRELGHGLSVSSLSSGRPSGRQAA